MVDLQRMRFTVAGYHYIIWAVLGKHTMQTSALIDSASATQCCTQRKVLEPGSSGSMLKLMLIAQDLK